MTQQKIPIHRLELALYLHRSGRKGWVMWSNGSMWPRGLMMIEQQKRKTLH